MIARRFDVCVRELGARTPAHAKLSIKSSATQCGPRRNSGVFACCETWLPYRDCTISQYHEQLASLCICTFLLTSTLIPTRSERLALRKRVCGLPMLTKWTGLRPDSLVRHQPT